MFFVSTNVTGPTHWLKGTTWTSAIERATTFTSREDAQQAIARAKVFNPKAARAARVVEVDHLRAQVEG